MPGDASVADLPSAVANALAETSGDEDEALAQSLREHLSERAAVRSFRRLKPNVYRVELTAPTQTSAYVAKLLPTGLAKTISRLPGWLAVVGLPGMAPVPHALARSRDSDSSWQVYECVPGRRVVHGDEAAVRATVDLVSDLHMRSSSKVDLLAGQLPSISVDLAFDSIAEAADALACLDPSVRGIDFRAVGHALDSLRTALDGAADRSEAHRGADLPVVLLHGDLWPVNAIVTGDRTKPTVRLVDWDKVAVGPASFDLSTILGRFAAKPLKRRALLERYQANVRRAGWSVPPPRELNLLAETWELARLAETLVWPARMVHDAEEWMRLWAMDELNEVARWVVAQEPLLEL